MEGCEACLIDASKVILFSAGQDGWGSVVSSYPILSHSIPSMAFSRHHHTPKQKHPAPTLKKLKGAQSFTEQGQPK